MSRATAGLSAGSAGRLRRWWAARWRRLLGLWGAGFVASVGITAASSLGYLEPLQAATLDLVQRLGGQRFPAGVVIVAIDDRAFAALGERQPISRAHLAKVIRGLQRSGAAAVGLDISLGTATTPQEDAALAAAIVEFARDGTSLVVPAAGRPPEAGPLADPGFRRAAAGGSDRVPIDRDGVIRRVALLVPDTEGRTLPTLGLAVLARIAGVTPEGLVDAALRAPGHRVRLPAWLGDGAWDPEGPPIPLQPQQLSRISFVGPEKSFLTIPSDAIVPLGEPGAPVAEDNPIRGRIVLVGATFTASRDFFQTPFGRLPGVEVHANVLHMLASRRLIRPSGWLTVLGIQGGVVVLAGVLLTLLRPLAGSLVAILITLLVGLPASYLALHGGGYAVDFLLPVVVTCALGVTAHTLDRRRFRDSFGRYVGRDVMHQILAENPALDGERREVSILISDLRNFTTLSEKLPAESVAAQLNDYFPTMVEAIFANRGTVDDFIGDGILAVFGAPLSDPGHARQAVRAAVAMQEALLGLNQQWEARGLPTLRMGVGVHTGVVFAGNVGGRERVKYTVIGDAVNVTARLEGLNKELGTEILLTHEAHAAVGDLAETRYRGEIPVKGRDEPLRVHEVVALRRDLDAARKEGDR